MAGKVVKIWYDPEGDYLEATFEQKEGYFRETESNQVMEKVDQEGNVLGFSVLNEQVTEKTARSGSFRVNRCRGE